MIEDGVSPSKAASSRGERAPIVSWLSATVSDTVRPNGSATVCRNRSPARINARSALASSKAGSGAESVGELPLMS